MKRLTVLVGVAVLIGFLGCKGPEGPQGPAGPAGPPGPPGATPFYIFGGVTSGYAEVVVLNTANIPTVKINEISIPYQGGVWFEHDNFPISPGQAANLVVTAKKINGLDGTANSAITLPGIFNITSHGDAATIPVGSDFTVSWSASTGATAYLYYFYIYYSYNGDTEEFEYEKDGVVTTTSVTFPSSEIFPDAGNITSIDYSSGGFIVAGVSGPCKEGDPGNVSGDGVGFFLGYTFGDGVYIEVIKEGVKGAFSPTLTEKPKRPEKDLLKELLKNKAKELGITLPEK